jgi:hypothetical protein
MVSQEQQPRVPQVNRLAFWSWYRQSARTDGALVRAPRRALGSLTGVFLIGWFLWMSRTQPKVAEIAWRSARIHPLPFLGIISAFAFMSFRSTILEYLAYSVYRAQGIHMKWVLFFPHRERELRRRYEQAFGRDKYLKAPELFGALAIAVFAISGFALVFTSR